LKVVWLVWFGGFLDGERLVNFSASALFIRTSKCGGSVMSCSFCLDTKRTKKIKSQICFRPHAHAPPHLARGHCAKTYIYTKSMNCLLCGNKEADKKDVRDNIFCTDCENKLGHFETLYNELISPKINSRTPLSPLETKILLFFWLSIILRCSLVRFGHFKLEEDLKLKCRAVVNKILGNSPEEIKRHCSENAFEFSLSVIPNINGPDKTRNFLSFHSKGNSHLVIINEYLLFFNFGTLKEIDDIVSELNFKINLVSDDSLYYLSSDERDVMIKAHFARLADLKIKFLVEAFKHQFLNKLKTQATPRAISNFVKELIFDKSVPLTVRYSNARVLSVINKHLKIV
jgi:hypothetical protein